ncbi:MAG: helix-turn-helix domain-containing protein [Mycobacteriales bacterium]
MTASVKRRDYDSSRRQAQARETQQAVLRSAHDLFLAHGYGGTTIAEVAAAAGVSAETVYGAFGNKAALLHRVWDVTIGGDDQEVMFHERPEVQALRAEPDLAKRLAMHAELATRTARRIGPFLLMVQAASGNEPAAAKMLAEMDAQRYRGLGFMAKAAAATGQLAVSPQECRDLMWATTDGVLWHRLVAERGWSDKRFAGWLGRMWISQLVGPPA